MRKNQNKPYFVGNVLHYWHDGKLKTFDCSNENVNNQAEKSDKRNGIGRTENGTFYQEKLPDEVVRALLETGEYLWTKGDRITLQTSITNVGFLLVLLSEWVMSHPTLATAWLDVKMIKWNFVQDAPPYTESGTTKSASH